MKIRRMMQTYRCSNGVTIDRGFLNRKEIAEIFAGVNPDRDFGEDKVVVIASVTNQYGFVWMMVEIEKGERKEIGNLGRVTREEFAGMIAANLPKNPKWGDLTKETTA